MPINNYMVQDYRDTLSYVKMIDKYGLEKMPPLIVTCAMTGGAQGKEANPNIPISIDEQVEQAYEVYQAGACMLHIHARDPHNPAKMSPYVEDYKELNAKIREKCPDLIINNTGGGMRYITRPDGAFTVSDRARHSMEALPEVGTVDITCFVNRVPSRNNIALAICEDIEKLVDEMHANNIKPEFECWKHDDFKYLRYLEAKGKLDKPFTTQLLFNGNGATPVMEELMLATRLMPENGMLSVIGIGAAQTAILTQAILLGHHVRVGMEDNVYYGYRQLADNNTQFVSRIIRIAKELGRPVATPAQAREMLGLCATPRVYSFPRKA